MKQPRILITGAGGFVGSHLLEYLQVAGLCRNLGDQLFQRTVVGRKIRTRAGADPESDRHGRRFPRG